MRLGTALGLVAGLLCGCLPAMASDPVEAEDRTYAFEDRALDPVTSDMLETFASDADYVRYIKRLNTIRHKHRQRWAGSDRPIVIAAMQNATEPEPVEMCTDPQLCPAEEADTASVVVTGTAATAPA
jgi:hypothetical protein